MLSSAIMVAALPAYYFLPSIVPDAMMMVALPPHVYVGLTHVISDYLPTWPAELIAFVVAAVIFFASFQLLRTGYGYSKIIKELWKTE
jgi:hypothetical protein